MSATVLVVEDDHALREALCATLEIAGLDARPAADARQALAMIAAGSPDLVVSDIRMEGLDGLDLLARLRADHPRLPVLLMTAYGTVQQAVEAMRRGALDYLIKPFEAEVLVGKVASYLGASQGGSEIVAEDPSSRELLGLAEQVAASDVTVMISGESGVGKEVLARFVHARSARAGGPFVALNCAAIPDNMLEAMLFGYEKGAFTGAYKACPGKFEQAQGGILLLDEITEMDLALQAKLLRVLQEREVERLGGGRNIALDLRVVATTNRDLAATLASGGFRDDLYYRLNVFPLHVRPLRERRADIVPLAEHLAAQAARGAARAAPDFTAGARRRLRDYEWPGNVRELDNVVQRALVLEPGPIIDETAIRLGDGPRPRIHTRDEPAAGVGAGLHQDLARSEHRLILEALAAGAGSRKRAAERLGISPRTLRYKLARMRAEGVRIPGSRACA